MLSLKLIGATLALLGASAAPSQRAATSIKVTGTGHWPFPDDTPAASFIDKDGTYYFQQSDSPYEIEAARTWSFFTGTNMDDAHLAPISNAVNPAEPRDMNNNTSWRCNNSPTGKLSSYAPKGSRYSQANHCDLMGVWIDPDTGDWIGLVHNEFTPQPFGDRLHFDAVDYAVSKDQGHTWDIRGHVLTSPYPTIRGDNATFPESTYSWGAGDPRLIVDIAAGYFYILYGSRIVDKGGLWQAFYTHAARAPMSGKLATGWHKFYDGEWKQPGVGGRESSLYPVDRKHPTGYTAPKHEYKPTTPGNTTSQIAKGQTPPTTPLFWMDVSYSAYLGQWIGEPSNVDRSGNVPQEFYVTDDLTSQKWKLLGDTGKFHTASNYRWFLDPVSKSSSSIIGKSVRAYCSYGCSGGAEGEFANVEFDSKHSASVIDTGKEYILKAGHRIIADGVSVTEDSQGAAHWRFKETGDGAYTITHVGSGALLSIPDTVEARAWGTAPTLGLASETSTEQIVFTAASALGVGQQWWLIPSRCPITNKRTGTHRIVNRHSGLVFAIGKDAETTPARSWTDESGSDVGGGRTAEEQEIRLVAV